MSLDVPLPSEVTGPGARPPDSRRRAVTIVGLLAALIVIVMVGRAFGGNPKVIEDEQAAVFADGALLAAITAVAQTTPDPRSAVSAALQNGEIAARTRGLPDVWRVVSSDGDALVVVVWAYANPEALEGPFTRRGWARACRSFDIRTAGVVARAVDCPAGTPERVGD